MFTKFNRWLTDHWQMANITTSMTDNFSKWLQGNVDGLKKSLVTVSRHVAAHDQPPFHAYVKYNVKRDDDVVDEPTATDL
jgi:hypothetical protein